MNTQIDIQSTVHDMYSSLVKILAQQANCKDPIVSVLLLALSSKYR